MMERFGERPHTWSSTTNCALTLTVALIAAAPPSAADDTPASPSRYQAMAQETLEQLVNINTTDSVGDTTVAAEAMAERLLSAGFPEEDVHVLGPDPRKGNLVARYRGTGERPPLLLLAHLDVVEAKREDWSIDPFVFLEEDGSFYGRGSSDDKAMAAIWVVNFVRMREEGFTPNRDLILALTADEEGGDHNGVLWLLDNQRPLIDAAYCLNEGGDGVIRDGRYLRNAGIPTYGVRGIFYDIDDNRAHGRDERIGVQQFFDGQEFLYRLVKALASAPVRGDHNE